MDDDKYDNLLKYLSGEFTTIKEELAKKADAEDLRVLRDEVNGLHGRFNTLEDKVENLSHELHEFKETVDEQFGEVQTAIGEALADDKKKIADEQAQQNDWIGQLATATGTRLKPTPNS